MSGQGEWVLLLLLLGWLVGPNQTRFNNPAHTLALSPNARRASLFICRSAFPPGMLDSFSLTIRLTTFFGKSHWESGAAAVAMLCGFLEQAQRTLRCSVSAVRRLPEADTVG